MTDVLDLAGWAVPGKRLDGAEDKMEAEYTVKPAARQKCGVLARLCRHGTR